MYKQTSQVSNISLNLVPVDQGKDISIVDEHAAINSHDRKFVLTDKVFHCRHCPSQLARSLLDREQKRIVRIWRIRWEPTQNLFGHTFRDCFDHGVEIERRKRMNHAGCLQS